jgi:hypothetical protein
VQNAASDPMKRRRSLRIPVILVTGGLLLLAAAVAFLSWLFPLRLTVGYKTTLASADGGKYSVNARYFRRLISRGGPAKLLVSKLKANHWARAHLHNSFGLYLVDIAVCTGQIGDLRVLLHMGAPVDGLVDQFAKPRSLRLGTGVWCTPLDDAVREDQPEIARILLGYGAVPNRLIPLGRRTFDTAVADAELSGHPILVRMFKPYKPPRYIYVQRRKAAAK